MSYVYYYVNVNERIKIVKCTNFKLTTNINTTLTLHKFKTKCYCNCRLPSSYSPELCLKFHIGMILLCSTYNNCTLMSTLAGQL